MKCQECYGRHGFSGMHHHQPRSLPAGPTSRIICMHSPHLSLVPSNLSSSPSWKSLQGSWFLFPAPLLIPHMAPETSWFSSRSAGPNSDASSGFSTVHTTGKAMALPGHNCDLIIIYGLPWRLNGKEPACNVGDLGSIPGLGRSHGGATHSSVLVWRIPMDRGIRWATVLGVTKSRTWLGD